MALYDSLFNMMDLTAAQLLVTAADFEVTTLGLTFNMQLMSFRKHDVVVFYLSLIVYLRTCLKVKGRTEINKESLSLLTCRNWCQSLVRHLAMMTERIIECLFLIIMSLYTAGYEFP